MASTLATTFLGTGTPHLRGFGRAHRSGTACRPATRVAASLSSGSSADAKATSHSRGTVDRRAATIGLASLAGSLALPQASWAEGGLIDGPDMTITDRAYLDIGVCVEGNRRADWQEVGIDGNIFCEEPQRLGRVVIGLYGNENPQSVAAFLSLVTGENGPSYKNTLFHRVVQGGYISAGKQGKRRNGELEGVKLERNREILSSRSFRLGHERPGTVSWAIGANDDEPQVQAKAGWQSAEFLITSGPKPMYELDGENIVIGRVLEGLDVVGDVAASPTFKPAQVLQTYNAIGATFGDKRATTVRKSWTRPRAPVVIVDAGVL